LGFGPQWNVSVEVLNVAPTCSATRLPTSLPPSRVWPAASGHQLSPNSHRNRVGDSSTQKQMSVPFTPFVPTARLVALLEVVDDRLAFHLFSPAVHRVATTAI
jgi:hypothetical protein